MSKSKQKSHKTTLGKGSPKPKNIGSPKPKNRRSPKPKPKNRGSPKPKPKNRGSPKPKPKPKNRESPKPESKDSSKSQTNPNFKKSSPKTYIKPSRKDGALYFPDFPTFRPNLTPRQILKMGSFGGTYFRPIHSSITGVDYRNVHNEFPKSWFSGLEIKKMITSEKCQPEVNKYGVKAGSSLIDWEKSGWIKKQDPYGWFQWYCRFYLGRRTPDDQRQVDRWDNYAGEKRGRWVKNLVGKIVKNNAHFDDAKISPVIRQGLQHWGYILTEKDYQKYRKNVSK